MTRHVSRSLAMLLLLTLFATLCGLHPAGLGCICIAKTYHGVGASIGPLSEEAGNPDSGAHRPPGSGGRQREARERRESGPGRSGAWTARAGRCFLEPSAGDGVGRFSHVGRAFE